MLFLNKPGVASLTRVTGDEAAFAAPVRNVLFSYGWWRLPAAGRTRGVLLYPGDAK